MLSEKGSLFINMLTVDIELPLTKRIEINLLPVLI